MRPLLPKKAPVQKSWKIKNKPRWNTIQYNTILQQTQTPAVHLGRIRTLTATCCSSSFFSELPLLESWSWCLSCDGSFTLRISATALSSSSLYLLTFSSCSLSRLLSVSSLDCWLVIWIFNSSFTARIELNNKEKLLECLYKGDFPFMFFFSVCYLLQMLSYIFRLFWNCPIIVLINCWGPGSKFTFFHFAWNYFNVIDEWALLYEAKQNICVFPVTDRL